MIIETIIYGVGATVFSVLAVVVIIGSLWLCAAGCNAILLATLAYRHTLTNIRDYLLVRESFLGWARQEVERYDAEKSPDESRAYLKELRAFVKRHAHSDPVAEGSKP